MPLNRPAVLLDQFGARADVCHAGPLRGLHSFGESRPCLYLIRSGLVRVRHGGSWLRIGQPSALLYPRPVAHEVLAPRKRGADLIAAHLTFAGGAADPIAATLPDFISVPLPELRESELLLKLLFEEAEARNCGREPMLGRLIEVVLMQILRHLMPQAPPMEALVAALSDPQLRRALVAMHEHPTREWTDDELASRAGMLRAEFRNAFDKLFAFRPQTHLQRLRIMLEWYSRASAAPDFFADDIAKLAAGVPAELSGTRPIVFVGSSSIRLWSTLQPDMAPLPVLNCGFGGAHISHVVDAVDTLVIPHRPCAVVLYAGDNDLDQRSGKPAEAVVRDFRTFVSRVRAAVPDTRIYYVSIKPSRLRYCDWPVQRQANAEISTICAGDPALAYIDIAGPMLSRADPPPLELFRFDGLHLSAEGYALWTSVIKPRLLLDFGPALQHAALDLRVSA